VKRGVFIDSRGTPIAGEALKGRRAVRWNADLQAFDKEGVVMGAEGKVLLVQWNGDYGVSECDPSIVGIPAVTNEMRERAEDALYASYRRQANPEKASRQRDTARKHARIALNAAVERAS
jgi:hypothetical protein